jgi:hypothetical protein
MHNLDRLIKEIRGDWFLCNSLDYLDVNLVIFFQRHIQTMLPLGEIGFPFEFGDDLGDIRLRLVIEIINGRYCDVRYGKV